jgi:hypothetical protein
MIPREHLDVETRWGTVRELIEGYRSSKRWQTDAATERQKELLVKWGVPVSIWLRKGEASHLIGKLLERVPPTNQQQCLLRKYGFWDWQLSRADASRVIATLPGPTQEEEAARRFEVG